MSFEKEFPSLKGKRLSIDGKIVEYKMKDGRKINVFREIEIEKYCFDKEKVRKAIENSNIHGFKCDCGRCDAIMNIKKELRIE